MSKFNKGIWIEGDHTGPLEWNQGPVTKVSEPRTSLDPDRFDEVVAKLDEILRALKAYEEAVPDPKELLNSARAATEELDRPHPRRDLMLDRLKKLSADLAPVVTVAGAVKPLLDELIKLVH